MTLKAKQNKILEDIILPSLKPLTDKEIESDEMRDEFEAEQDQAEKRRMADQRFIDKYIALTLKAEQEELRDEANYNNALYHVDPHRMEEHRATNVTFSDAQIAAITSPR